MCFGLMAGISNMRPPTGRMPGSRVGEVLDQGIAASNKVPQPRVVLTGPVAILWDIENCPVPGEVNAEDVAGNIRMALRAHPAVKGAVTMFSAYGDFNHFPRRLREGCQRTGVNLIDVPNGKKDASDKAILVDMFLFALDNPPPCTILLISGDVDFAPAIHKLGQRGYTMVLAIPAGVGVSSVLCNAGRYVWDWPSVARGDGLVPAKIFLNRFGEERITELSACMMGSAWQSGDDSDFLTEDERNVCNRQINSSTVLSGHVGSSQLMAGAGLSYGRQLPFDFNRLTVSQVPTQYRIVSSHSFSNEESLQATQAYEVAVGSSSCNKAVPNSYSNTPPGAEDCGLNSDIDSWVQPGDLQGLKGQLIRLVKLNGGKLQLLRLPSEYCKLFGRPLYLAEYGSPKLIHLIERMPDALMVKGEGNKRTLHLKEHGRIQSKHRRLRADAHLGGMQEDNAHLGGMQEDKSGDLSGQVMGGVEDFVEDIVLPQRLDMGSDEEKASDGNEEFDKGSKVLKCVSEEQDVLDEETHMLEVLLEVFRQEVQELLVSHACKIPLLSFQTLYRQRYGHELDVAAFGIEELDVLFEKMEDMVAVIVDKATSSKFLVAR